MQSVDAVGYYGLDQYHNFANGPASSAIQLKHCSTPQGLSEFSTMPQQTSTTSQIKLKTKKPLQRVRFKNVDKTMLNEDQMFGDIAEQLSKDIVERYQEEDDLFLSWNTSTEEDEVTEASDNGECEEELSVMMSRNGCHFWKKWWVVRITTPSFLAGQQR